MWLLRTLQLMFLVCFVWVMVFEVLIPLATQTPMFPLFRDTKDKADKRDRRKKNAK